jgi:hypothetical protein
MTKIVLINVENVMAERTVEPEVIEQLAAFFHRNGYARFQKADRLVNEGYRAYKKGDEVRLVAADEEELVQIRQLLYAAGFLPGNPYLKGKKWAQPVYGRKEVARFLSLIAKPLGTESHNKAT